MLFNRRLTLQASTGSNTEMHEVGQMAKKVVNVDPSPVHVQKDQWPSFDNWEFTVIFKEDLSPQEMKTCRKFLVLVSKTGICMASCSSRPPMRSKFY